MSDDFFDKYNDPQGVSQPDPFAEEPSAKTESAAAPYQPDDAVSAQDEGMERTVMMTPEDEGEGRTVFMAQDADSSNESNESDDPATALFNEAAAPAQEEPRAAAKAFEQNAGEERTITTNPYAHTYIPPFATPLPTQQRPQSSTQNFSGGYYQNGYTAQHTQPAQTPTNPYTSDSQADDKNRKKKKSGNGSGIAFILVICILVSTVAGFGGSMLANYFTKSAAKEEGSLVVHKVDPDTEEADKEQLVDKSTSEITTEVADTVVEITTESMQTSSFYGQYISQGAGSGVIISKDGYIFTNNHVIEGATSIQVTTRGGESYEAKLIGTDAEMDIALLKIDASDLPFAVLGDSSKLQVGDKAVIIGNPLGTLGGSVTEGIISALDRSIAIDGKTMHLMQTDAAINPGNSGGGMFNGQGELVGIVVAKSSSEEIDNIGFVIPINNAYSILSDLKDYGYVRGRADTGMTFMDMTSPMFAWYYYHNTETGVYINSVERGSNAQTAGFMQGDRVVSVDGKDISTSDDITKIIAEKSAGDTVSFVVNRKGSNVTLNLTLDEYVPDGVNTGTTR